jgi:hypothetical protein
MIDFAIRCRSEVRRPEMLNMNDVRTEQRIAQERYQVIVLARQQARARAESGKHQATLRGKPLSRLGQLWQRGGSQPSARYDAAGEQTA